jgi:acyl phosphate:glycerol-3-phosphate acyltransferase
MLRDGLLILGAYLLGAIPFGFLVAGARGVDIRKVGSGNIGATNVGRVLGKKWGFLVFGLDLLKGLAPTLTARLLHHGEGMEFIPLTVALTGLAAIAGHNWPVYLRFKGGKGVATSAGVFLALFWQGTLIALGVWLVCLAITRYVSVSSIVAAVALLAGALWLRPDALGKGVYLTGFAALAAVLSIARHRSNLVRLWHGTEPKVGAPKSNASGTSSDAGH